MQVYLYADDKSADLLAAARPKALVMGGDFDHGQLDETGSRGGPVSGGKAMSAPATVALCAVDVASMKRDVAALRLKQNADALVFATKSPIPPDLSRELGLCLVGDLGQLSRISVHGNGCLDTIFGDFILMLVARRWQLDEARNDTAGEVDLRRHTSEERTSTTGKHAGLEGRGGVQSSFATSDPLAQVRALSLRLQACNDRLSIVGHDARYFRGQLARVDADLQAALSRERDLSERLQAHSEQLTVVGNDAHYFRDEYLRAQAALRDLSVRENELATRMQDVLRSRSWRWTRSFRAVARFVKTGRFNSAGTVGLFGAAQAIGRRVPMPQSWRSLLGRLLAKFRRH